MNAAARVLALSLGLAGLSDAAALSGIVRDAHTRLPIAGAIVTAGATPVRTRADGSFEIAPGRRPVGVRAHGYSREELSSTHQLDGPVQIHLRGVSPRAVHLSMAGAVDPTLRDAVARLPQLTQIDALVIEVKSERGELAGREVHQIVRDVHKHGMYAIARISVFKDDFLVGVRPDTALRTHAGAVVRDNDGGAWTDPQNRAVWDYNIAIAVEAARRGFDEIQFDYVRFPSVTEARRPAEAGRRAAVRGFLAAARRALAPYNVFVAADVFGFASWHLGDTNVGQNLEEMAAEVDYICLMLYPSSFKRGLPAVKQPLEDPGGIIELSLRRAQERTGLPSHRFRPWLQAFPDYNFDRRPFRQLEIAAQIQAAERFGAHGWMLWNPRSLYSAHDLPMRARHAVR